MAATVLDGEALAQKVRSEVALEVAELAKAGVVPGLGTILVGDDAPSARYVAMKHEDCTEVGMNSVHSHLPADVSQEDLLDTVRSFNENPEVDAYLIQLPLPKHLDEEKTLLAVDPDKDVDGLHPVNLGRLVMGAPGPLPCTPAGIVELLAEYEVEVEGKNVVIIGRGLTIGRPLALLLALRRPHCNAAVTVAAHRCEEPLALHLAGRRHRRRSRVGAPRHRRHGEARCRGSRRRRLLGRSKDPLRRRSRGRR